jgi:hypothetical protein
LGQYVLELGRLYSVHFILDVTTDASALMNSDAAAEDLVSSLQVLEVTSPAIHPEILPQVNICLIQK